MFKHKVIKAVVNDSSDYEFITDQGIHNTLRSIWQWADRNSVKVSFEKTYNDDLVYGLELNVNGTFEHKEDLALFKITYGSQPFNKLQMNNDEPEFIHE